MSKRTGSPYAHGPNPEEFHLEEHMQYGATPGECLMMGDGCDWSDDDDYDDMLVVA